MTHSAVEIDDLTVVFRHGWPHRALMALDAVSFDLREGDFLALIGPNGAGKSTILYCMLGLLRPTRGTARVFGTTLRPGSREFRDIAYLPEEPHYHDYLTVEEAIRYYARLSGSHPTAAQMSDLLDRLNLARVRSAPVGACSKGMKQKVGIAQCLLQRPKLLLVDEPMRGLDPIAVKDFRDVMVDLNRRGVTVVMSSHQLSEVELVASRVAILVNGRLVAIDDIGAFARRSTDETGSLEDTVLALIRKGEETRA
jgi:ABC-type multidrug transport system ATPase subunit